MKKMINEIENQKNIKVIWLGLRGSKLKGYAKPDSDIDYLAIFIPSGGVSDYLTFEPKNNLDNFTIQKDNLDIQFLELRSAINSIIKNEVNILQSVVYSNVDDEYSVGGKLLKDLVYHTFNKEWYMSRLYSILQGYVKKDYAMIGLCKEFISSGLIVLTFLNNYKDDYKENKVPVVWANNLIYYADSLNTDHTKLAREIDWAIKNRVNGDNNNVSFEQWELLKKFANLISKPTYSNKILDYKLIDSIFYRLAELGGR